MSSIRKIAIVTVIASMGTGCCLTRHCGLAGGGGRLMRGTAVDCDAGACSPAGCHSCGGGPVIPCKGRAVGSCLGLGCIGKLFSIANYGCTSCATGGGCGEVYYHDWISDPPCADPCDGLGNWTGHTAGDCCSGCAGGCDSCLVEPACGAAIGLGLGSGVRGRPTGFQVSGRALYATWMGVGGVFHGLRHSVAPTCSSCNGFSFSQSCAACSAGHSPGAFHSGAPISTSEAVPVEHAVAVDPPATSAVVQSMRTSHGRPPHRVLTKRLQ